MDSRVHEALSGRVRSMQMLGRRRPVTSKGSRRLGCFITTSGDVRASTISIAAASSSCGIGSRGFRRTLTHSDNGGTNDGEERGGQRGDGDWREEGRGIGRAKPVSDQRRSVKPRPSGGLLRQVVWARGAKASRRARVATSPAVRSRCRWSTCRPLENRTRRRRRCISPLTTSTSFSPARRRSLPLSRGCTWRLRRHHQRTALGRAIVLRRG